ncbi:hypothetical protein B6D19_09490 [Gilliamella apicola]|uniref:hypothetical protein n=1 Tax=Gilliamella apicola TaxID=1196095 RepID=UPI000A33830D|nr:hypothetical protein [Gilliamella apicola]OTQ31215.1 hypothetical protein B6D19_09490 [Gilliamella apicola]OTQ45457.1 hypothetical protein B6D20_04065 [Gilliamella apicola]
MSWSEIYLNYDQDALAVYANVGVIRRALKDIEANKVKLIEHNQSHLIFEVDNQQVKLTPQGIQAAKCSCPASDHCKHIIASVLWLHENPLIDKAKVNTSCNTVNQPDKSSKPNSDPLAELLAIDSSQLFKTVGKANIRLAYQLLFDWLQNDVITVQTQGVQLRIQVPLSTTPIIYTAGTGFAGIISELPDKQKQAVHLAVIAYLFQQNQKKWVWPDQIVAEHEQKNQQDQLCDNEIILITQIQNQINALITHGLSHVSTSQANQLQLLNMSARAQGLPKLAAMLRQLCQLVGMQANRHFAIEEQEIILLLARLTVHLQTILNSQGQQLVNLRGKQKRQYQTDKQTLDLLPLGAYWWQSKTGAQGVTFYFWHPEHNQYYQTTLARSNNADINFNRYSIWNSISLWQSMPNMLMRKRFSLNNPLLAEGNNLSSTGSSVVLKSTGWSNQDYQEFRASNGFRNWKELSRYLQNSDVSEGLFDQVIAIHVTNTQKQVLDEIKQSLVWCIKDNQNNQLLLRLFWDGIYTQRIDILNLFIRTAHQPLTVLVKCIKNDSNLDLEPFAIIYKESKTDQINIANLDFDYEWLYPKGKNYKAFEASKEPILKKQIAQINYQQDPIATYIIKPTMALLEAITSSGRLILSNADKQKINQLQYQCDTLGLTTLSHTLNKLAQNQPIEIKHILQTAYLCQLMNNTHYQLPIVIKGDET